MLKPRTKDLRVELARSTCSAADLRYRSVMEHNEPEAGGAIQWLRARQHIFIGILGLIAWLAMLWFMFGDVL